eukprot:TRINITY_DN7571_c0_g1_i1.p1 TRINITY_DN7571_c0_g1~~TRINITY_DN7571_c0_g1_i1.p1  ORF type:complete len:127 (+),score=15.76 TRINITY_DN7571_c0_g1_i1:31-381(+)
MAMSIKCNLNGEVRRFTLKESRYEVLKEMVQKIFHLPDSFVLKYQDDEDELVSLGSDLELEEAIALHSGKKLLYLTVVPVSTSRPKRIIRAFFVLCLIYVVMEISRKLIGGAKTFW